MRDFGGDGTAAIHDCRGRMVSTSGDWMIDGPTA